jgi:hypothetical protein
MTAHQKRTPKKEIDVRVTYGLGGSVFGQFPRHRVAGMSARELIQLVIDGPQPPGSAARTAKVLADVLRTQRMIDAELTRAAGGQADGDPISLDQVVVKEEDVEEQRESPVIQDTEEVTIRLSEAYRGGRRW